MKQKNIRKLFTIGISRIGLYTLLLAPLYITGVVSADNADEVLRSAEEIGGPDSASSITDLIATIINILSFAGGVIAVIMIIIGGMKITLANGDSGKVASGRNAIIYALVGLVVIVMAQALVRFVLTNVGT